MDEKWVAELYSRYSGTLLRYLNSHTNNLQDAEDILQDTFASIHKHASNYDPKRCNEEAWIYIIAKRKLISYYRSKKPLVNIDEICDSNEGLLSIEDDASLLLEQRETIAAALNLLDERSRQIVIMKYFLDLSDTEISGKLGLSNVNVRVIRSRAINKMKGATKENE